MENPRGTAQGGGGPPWLRATPDPNNPVSPQGGGQGPGQGQGKGQGQGQGSGANTAVSTPPTSSQQGTSLQFTGEVININSNTLTFKNGADGTTIDAMLGPPWFWSENSIPLNPGDQISLEGFESPDHMELNWLINLTTGKAIQFRDAAGTPVWTE